MKTVIIGGGAAGMMSAYFSAKCGDEVVLLEKNEKLGKKLYITGKGRCNLTNDCDVNDFFNCVVTNPKFMLSSVRSFSPADVMALFESFGLKLKTERGNRVFPLSDKSSDVIKCLSRALENQNVTVRLNTKVTRVEQNSGRVSGIYTENEFIACDRVIICTGGISYPLTGSTGDGYKFARETGHEIMPLRPALCGLKLKGDFSNLAGLSLKNTGYKVISNGKEIYRDFGELLFTHKGISGPVVLSSSSYISAAGNGNIFTVSIDLKPSLDEKTLDQRILRDFALYKNKVLKNALIDLLPKSLIGEVIRAASLSENSNVSELTQENRKKLLYALKNLNYQVTGLMPIEEAIVTGGGVNVKQIDPKTMESKLVKGLYFAGEVIDVDALTGGFNLQCAFSSAHAAALTGRKEEF